MTISSIRCALNSAYSNYAPSCIQALINKVSALSYRTIGAGVAITGIAGYAFFRWRASVSLSQTEPKPIKDPANQPEARVRNATLIKQFQSVKNRFVMLSGKGEMPPYSPFAETVLAEFVTHAGEDKSGSFDEYRSKKIELEDQLLTSDAWSQKATLEAADRLMRISFALSCSFIDELALKNTGLLDRQKAFEDLDPPKQNVFFYCLEVYLTCRIHSWIEENLPANAALFYKEGNAHFNWQVLYNEYCERLHACLGTDMIEKTIGASNLYRTLGDTPNFPITVCLGLFLKTSFPSERDSPKPDEINTGESKQEISFLKTRTIELPNTTSFLEITRYLQTLSSEEEMPPYSTLAEESIRQADLAQYSATPQEEWNTFAQKLQTRDAWNQEETVQIADRLMKISFAVSCSVLDSLASEKPLLRNTGEVLKNLKPFDKNNLFLCSFVYQMCRLQMPLPSSDVNASCQPPTAEEFAVLSSLFYKEGHPHFTWRMLYNEFCARFYTRFSANAVASTERLHFKNTLPDTEEFPFQQLLTPE